METEYKPRALDLAASLDGSTLHDDDMIWHDTLHEAADEMRRLHARTLELEDHITRLTTWKKDGSHERTSWEVMKKQESIIEKLEAEAVVAAKELATKSKKIQELEDALKSVSSASESTQKPSTDGPVAAQTRPIGRPDSEWTTVSLSHASALTGGAYEVRYLCTTLGE